MPSNAKTVNMEDLSPLIEELINGGTDIVLTVTGNSMYPILRNKTDRVLLTRVNGRLKKYDIPLYMRGNGQYVLHRIVKVKKDCYYLNGDNQTFVEQDIYHHQIKAVVKEIQRGRLVMSVRHPLYLLYSRIWVWFFAFRKPMVTVYLKLARIIFRFLRRKRS